MLHNIKPDKLMQDCIEEASKGSSVYTKQQEEEIRLIFHTNIRKGLNFNRIYDKEIKDTYPLPKGEGLFASYARLREIFTEEAKRYKAETSIDREYLWNMLYERFNELYYNDSDKHDLIGMKKTLDSMMKLITAANQEKVLDSAKDTDGEITYRLDFNI